MSILDLGQYMFGDVDQQIGWFQSKGLLAMNKSCPVCSQPMDMQNAVMSLTSIGMYTIIQQNTMCLGHNSLWYAFVTDGDVVILPAGSQQGLGMGPSLLSPTWHCSNGCYWCTGGLVNIQLLMQPRRPKSRKTPQSRHTSISGTFAAGGSWTMMHHSCWVDSVLLCTLTSLFLDTSPRYGTRVWLL